MLAPFPPTIRPASPRFTAAKARDLWLQTRLETYKTLQPYLFSPRKEGEREKRFLVIGDPGSGNRHQLGIGRQMAKRYAQKPFGSVLVLGDNVYMSGKPERFDQRIYEPYKTLFQDGVRFYPILGNHDVRKNEDALKQLGYWGSPPYYQFNIGPASIFALDTTLILPGFDGCHNEHLEEAKALGKQQLQWLDEALGKSDAKMKIVMGHYPLYSSSLQSKARGYPAKMREQLEPILKRHGVDLYLAGHDHYYERTGEIQGLRHIITGAAGKLVRTALPFLSKHPIEKVRKTYHFMAFEVHDDGHLSFEVLNKRGRVLDQGDIPIKAGGLNLTDAAAEGLRFGVR